MKCAYFRYIICKIITSVLGSYFIKFFLKKNVLLVTKVIILLYVCFPNIMLLITKVIILLSTKKKMNGYKEAELKEIGPRCEIRLFQLKYQYNNNNTRTVEHKVEC